LVQFHENLEKLDLLNIHVTLVYKAATKVSGFENDHHSGTFFFCSKFETRAASYLELPTRKMAGKPAGCSRTFLIKVNIFLSLTATFVLLLPTIAALASGWLLFPRQTFARGDGGGSQSDHGRKSSLPDLSMVGLFQPACTSLFEMNQPAWDAESD
jgi:hypothetical protein